MTNSVLKKLIRERRAKTGEKHQPAHRHVKGSRAERSATQPQVPAKQRSLTELWLDMCAELPTTLVAERTSWTDLEQIVQVLRVVSSRKNGNHMLYPSLGGNDCEGVEHAAEPGCLRLKAGSTYCIVRPAKLTFEHFPHDPESSFLRLDLAVLAPFGSARADAVHEELTELAPGEYCEYSVWAQGHQGLDDDENEIPLPVNACGVARYFRGTFVFLGKHSRYNLLPYLDDHMKLDQDHFRERVRVARGT